VKTGKEEQTMNDSDKVNHIIDHWIEHEEKHTAEYEEWAKKIGALEDGSRKAAIIIQAAGKLNDAVEILKREM
jgi:hypothetical protein